MVGECAGGECSGIKCAKGLQCPWKGNITKVIFNWSTLFVLKS